MPSPYRTMKEAEAAMRRSIEKSRQMMKAQIRAGFDPVRQQKFKRGGK